MKSHLSALALLSLFLVISSAKECMEEDRCRILEKYQAVFPRINEAGARVPEDEKVLYHPIAVYDDKLVVYESKRNTKDLVEIGPTSSTKQDQKLIVLSIPYSQIHLDCNVDGNKLCTMGQYQQEFGLSEDEVARVSSLEDADKHCVIVPMTYSVNENPHSLVYMFICETDESKKTNLFRLKHSLSRKIAEFQTQVMLDARSSHNGVTRMSGSFYAAVNSAYDPTFLTLTFRRMRSVQSSKDLNVVSWDHFIEELGGEPMTVPDAINADKLDKEWAAQYGKLASTNTEPDPTTCFWLPVQNQPAQILCSAEFDPETQDAQVSAGMVKLWVKTIATTLKKRNFVNGVAELLGVPEPYDLDKFPTSSIFIKKTLANTKDYAIKDCDELKGKTLSASDEFCGIFVMDELQQTIVALSFADANLKAAIEAYAKANLGLSEVDALKPPGAFRFKSIFEEAQQKH